MDIKVLRLVFSAIADKIVENKDYLTHLDQQSGDGDLGISMSDGFSTTAAFFNGCEIADLGMAFNKAANVFNECAPSSLGTICAFIMKGMAKTLKGKTDVGVSEIAEAMLRGVDSVTEKAGSKRNEKTILDSFYPGAEALRDYAGDGVTVAAKKAAEAAVEGAEKTKEMRAVWGRAAYFGEKSIGLLDGGSVVGRLVFEAISEWVDSNL